MDKMYDDFWAPDCSTPPTRVRSDKVPEEGNLPQAKAYKGAVKYDAGKPAIFRGVLARFPRAIEAVAEVSALGCRKYNLPPDDRAFMDVPDGFGRYTDADARHLLAETSGPWNVEKGGALQPNGEPVLHAAQHAWCALARLEILLRYQKVYLTVTRPQLDTSSPTPH